MASIAGVKQGGGGSKGEREGILVVDLKRRQKECDGLNEDIECSFQLSENKYTVGSRVQAGL